MMSRVMFASEQLMAAKSAVNRIEEVINEQPLSESATPQQPKDASVSFENVSFSYAGAEKKALDQVSFEIPEGKTVALVGASGSGKSTAAKLIPRFYDASEGEVLVVGVNVKDMDKEALMKQIAFVFQSTKLFKDTLLENIRAARPEASREEVLRAAKAAQCDEIIDRLPEGLDTIVGNGGTYLSGGENQRVALARAILKDAPVILLDEATASLDVDNETEIQEAISKLVKGKTVLVIAHRMRTVENADQIVVLADGVVAENGTHDEFMKKDGLYARLVRLQTQSAEWKL